MYTPKNGELEKMGFVRKRPYELTLKLGESSFFITYFGGAFMFDCNADVLPEELSIFSKEHLEQIILAFKP